MTQTVDKTGAGVVRSHCYNKADAYVSPALGKELA
jgi:hypothetical protein